MHLLRLLNFSPKISCSAPVVRSTPALDFSWLFPFAEATFVLPKILAGCLLQNSEILAKAILAFAKIQAFPFIMPKILAKALLALAKATEF